jgi:hypothetical protein
MGGCEPGHDWRPEQETANFVRFRCADCDSVCVAPRPVNELCLDVRRTTSPRRVPSPPRRRAETPRWASVSAR